AMKALAYADREGLARFVSAQMYYSLAGRDIEREIVPLALDQQIAILPWSPLAGGLLSGKFDLESTGPEGARRTTFDFPPDDRVAGRSGPRSQITTLKAQGSRLNTSLKSQGFNTIIEP